MGPAVCCSLTREEDLNAHSKSEFDDEFDGIFDKLTPHTFVELSTLTCRTEYEAFGDFVDSRLDTLPTSYAPGKNLTHAALSNGHVLRLIVPIGDEELVDYLQRLARNALDMEAHSFFFCRIVDASSVIKGAGFCVFWFAHHVTPGEQTLRSGIIPIENRKLAESSEAPDIDFAAAPVGQMLTRVLPQ
jgi:hypothetical protein